MNSWFTRALMAWNRKENARSMPWKGEKDPYKIWISEIILQQTRVEQGLAYYERFIQAFPTVAHLAKAPEKEVFKIWEGLGYYSRCRNLISAAHTITKVYNGVFPDEYPLIRELSGIGPYTAAAIGSFAFNLPYAVVDGNVFRVLARVFGIGLPVDKSEGKKYFENLALELLDKKYPGLYNQAIMDFGAVICKPKNPLCDLCPFRKNCRAFQLNQIDKFPVKSKKADRRKRWLYYFIIEKNKEVLIRERKSKDIWQHLYEFVLYEKEGELTLTALKELAHQFSMEAGTDFLSLDISEIYKQQLTHLDIEGRFLLLKIKDQISVPVGYEWVPVRELKKFPFPKYILSYLMEKG